MKKITQFFQDLKDIGTLRESLNNLYNENLMLRGQVTSVSSSLRVLSAQNKAMAEEISQLSEKAALRSNLTKRQQRGPDGKFI